MCYIRELVQLVLMLFLKEVTCFLIVFFYNRTLCSAAQENNKIMTQFVLYHSYEERSKT